MQRDYPLMRGAHPLLYLAVKHYKELPRRRSWLLFHIRGFCE